MKYLHLVSYLFLIVGGVNWGLIALFNYNLVEVLGFTPGVERLVYLLVGASAVFVLFTHKDDCKTCAAIMKGK